MLKSPRWTLAWLTAALLLSWCVGIFGRGYWTPDEPREADIAWRMSWQANRAVPVLAGEAFCEKPPLTYWVSAAAMRLLGTEAWASRVPNLLYAVITALSVGLLARRSAGPIAGLVAAAAISTFLLSYQVAIWLATDAPLLATVSVALWGLYIGFYAGGTSERLRGYSLLHAALALGFMSKSAAAWMVPALAWISLVIWEKRWRELWRWELYIGLILQAAVILPWVWLIYRGPDGTAQLKVFFWNNLIGRFTSVDAPEALQYATAHRNSPGKYLIELPLYLWPWTLLVLAAARRAWQGRHAPFAQLRPVRFALAAALPALAVLSVAATARNIYLAPALPGVALLLGWWAREIHAAHDHWDLRALRATAVLLLLGAIVILVALTLVGAQASTSWATRASFVLIGVGGTLAAAVLAIYAQRAARGGHLSAAQCALLFAYCALLVGPASQLYRQVDRWQDLASIGRAVERDAAGRALVLFAPDETTRAFIDRYARTSVAWIPGPVGDASIERLRAALSMHPHSLALVQLPGRDLSPLMRRLARRADTEPPLTWIGAAQLRIAARYALPNGRRYALLEKKL